MADLLPLVWGAGTLKALWRDGGMPQKPQRTQTRLAGEPPKS
jgi:hypothetical protein